MKIHWPSVGEFANAAWRPFTGYGGAVSLIVGMFRPEVTPEKMVIMAGVLGGLGFLKTRERIAAIKTVPAPEGSQ